ncbi:hypothetical protein D3H55_14630 [Bacillus salacetis]|uniref:Uncharacterized protein n=1 Tax=Bacillus salacetis TaxID=2315464 RepID=A0A3A1QYB5_9BACI|nr:hypothetical protein [Bacillus salacetis]RIW31855.1 hypothetical protein D3H55_14630 [Bacillus salacetis]
MNSSIKNYTSIHDDFSKDREKIKEDILFFYSEQIPDILEALFTIAHFEKKITVLEPLFESPFHYRFIENYGLNLFIDGFIFSLYSKANMLNEFLKEDISSEVKKRLDTMTADASIRFEEDAVECFTLTAYKVFEFGVEAGKGYTM